LGNDKGTREANGQGSWAARYYPDSHPKALTREGKRAVRLWVFRKTVDTPLGPKVVQGTGKSKAVALGNFDRAVKAVGVPDELDPRTLRVKDWVPRSIEGRRRAGESSKATYLRMARNHIVDEPIGRRRLVDLTALEVDAFLAGKERAGLAPRYLNLLRFVLLSALHDAHAKGLPVDTRTFDRAAVPTVQVPAGEKPAMTGKQARDLVRIAYERRDPLWLFVRLGLASGARRSELVGARREDFDRERGVWEVRRKVVTIQHKGLDGAKGRVETRVEQFIKGNKPGKTVPLAASFFDALDEWMGERQGWLFPSTRGDLPMAPNTVQQAIKTTYKLAKLPESFGCHKLRHTASRLLRRLGGDPRAVAEHLGHSIEVAMSDYWDADTEIGRALAGKLAGVLDGDT
jgi:integrase